ncbi:hypothetical protein SAMN05443572_111231 [Myxococcus fulvus]|uniref:ADYC domain-containing protein n=1 Tax=Myxococcus fulvus TaxID=33 RepID=A0A511TD46_MYXFU|nr:hypothetical protein MFU01_71410 [Myxococcus fulvus]SEU36586.1 hypothetical protein SAMN05443572_111231 [Myxococcus fulvus]
MPLKQAPRPSAFDSRMRSWLLCLLMLFLAPGVSGCCALFPGSKSCVKPTPPPGEPDPNESLPVRDCSVETCELGGRARPLTPWECPTGQPNCQPPETNGLGIYIVEGGNYCFVVDGSPRFCPEAFENVPASASFPQPSVRLMGRDPTRSGGRLSGYTVSGLLQNPQAPGAGEGVRIHSIQATGTQLTVNYCSLSGPCLDRGTQVHSLRGEELHRLKLVMLLPADDGGGPRRAVILELAVTPRADASARVHGYDVLYREYGTGLPWLNHCAPRGVTAPDRDPTSFLPGLRINSVNAAVEPVSAWTTIGCESGAIVTCLDWGYAPWSPDTGGYDVLRGYVFGSCLQAKRAAYFVGRGDLASYTRNGTRIARRDEFGLGRSANNHVEELRTLEALWSPQGAVCLNPENRRVPDMLLPEGLRGVPPCASPPTWTPTGKLATGRLSPAPD